MVRFADSPRSLLNVMKQLGFFFFDPERKNQLKNVNVNLTMQLKKSVILSIFSVICSLAAGGSILQQSHVRAGSVCREAEANQRGILLVCHMGDKTNKIRLSFQGTIQRHKRQT